MNRIYVVKLRNLLVACILIATLTCTALFGASVLRANAQDGIPLKILMYHQISDKSSKWGEFVISPQELENDIIQILKLGYTPITLQDVLDFVTEQKPLPQKPIMLTFDDGYESDYVYVFPLLKKYNVKAVFSIVGAYADKYSKDVPKHIDYSHSNWEQIREMQQSGLAEIQSHTYNLHENGSRRGALPKKGEDFSAYQTMLLNDIKMQHEAFQKNQIKEPFAFTYPYGFANKESEAVILQKYQISVGVAEKDNYLKGTTDDLKLLNRYNRTHNRDIGKILNK